MRRDDARRLLASGVDPGIERKIQTAASVERAANSFEAVAREWFAKQAPGWAASHADKIMGRLENDVFRRVMRVRFDEAGIAPSLFQSKFQLALIGIEPNRCSCVRSADASLTHGQPVFTAQALVSTRRNAGR